MTDTTTAVPAWLATAEADWAEREISEKASKLRLVMNQADKINRWLAEFGIEPQNAAYVDPYGNLHGAVLIGANYAHSTYEVPAYWDGGEDGIELHTADWEDNPTAFRRVRLLHTIGDVAAARHETPKFPAQPRNLAAEARRAIDSLNVDSLNNAEVEAVVTAINGVTAALLNLAERGSHP